MRIPRVHDLTLAYCELFGLPLRPFVMGNPKTLVHIDGQRMTVAEADAEPERLPFDLADHEKGKTWTAAVERGDQRVPRAVREGRPGVARRPAARIRPVLDPRVPRRCAASREGALELYGVMSFRESNMNAAVVEQLREIVGRGVRGHAGDRRRHGPAAACVLRAAQAVRPLRRRGHTPSSRTELGDRPLPRTGGRFSVTRRLRDLRHPVLASCATSRSWARRFSREKQKAIRELNYNASTKILFQTRHRFWEAEDGIVGGTTVTDLPIRRICYPSFSDPNDERGTLLASYTWGQDALRWGAMDAEDDDRAGARGRRPDPPVDHDRVRGRRRRTPGTTTRTRAAPSRCSSRSSRRGCRPAIVAPEGRIHFAGEHTSLYHAWIQGALESGIRAAREIHEARPAAVEASA